MDSQPPSDGHLIDIVDNEWRLDELPNDQILVPSEKLPDPEADTADAHLTLTEQEQKWNDLALSSIVPELAVNDQTVNT
uniref:Anaphase-promoting complex subunit 13 n=1 Tax=Culicoides sonorensis TaxID=179676 RepID=A0A336LCX2_CULSO